MGVPSRRRPHRDTNPRVSSASPPTLELQKVSKRFGSVEELSAALERITAATQIVTIEAGHDLLGGKFDVSEVVVKPFHDTLAA